jgi:3-dehydroquinate synthase
MRYALITDHIVAKLYGKKLCHHLHKMGYDIALFSFPAGEASKTRQTKERLEDGLLKHHYSRDTTIIALGGGVVTDLAGFLAATYCRGVSLILIPTTLMAMCDAAIGGKTGVNTPCGKNMIGAFYLPHAIHIHPGFLKTLPEQELFCGTVEILKAGLIADAELFFNFSSFSVEEALGRAIEVKRRIVAHDMHDVGKRRFLNLGHTLGHAIEAASGFQLSHGKAVAMGIVLEAKISHRLGLLNTTALSHIEAAFPPVVLPCPYEAIMQPLTLDKKGRFSFVLLQDIADPVVKEVPVAIIEEIVHDAFMCTC